MNATEVIAELKKLPIEDKENVFAYLVEEVTAGRSGQDKPWLGRKLTFDEACEVVFRENRELLGSLAK